MVSPRKKENILYSIDHICIKNVKLKRDLRKFKVLNINI